MLYRDIFNPIEMIRTIFILICGVLMLAGCNQTSEKHNRMELQVSKDGDSLRVRGITHPDDSGRVYLRFREGMVEEMIQKDSMQVITLIFNPGDSLWVSGSLMPVDTVGNIRFNQILMPDSTGDGPFGRDISYELAQRGTYQLLIGENMMAGDPWAGVFTVKMKLSNTENKEK